MDPPLARAGTGQGSLAYGGWHMVVVPWREGDGEHRPVGS